jgi:DNA-binding LacI/PurR family transcriptional regulator
MCHVSPEPPNPRPISIYDVAKAAGVAPSTVSRAFSRPGRVNAETAERIRRIAAALGYRAHLQAGATRTGLTSVIALVVADVTNPFYNDIISAAEATAADADYTVLLVNTQGSPDIERDALERTLPMIDGIVLATSVMSDSTIRMIGKQRPVTVLNRSVSDVPSIISDNPRGMRRAVEHLAELGHHSITYAAGPEAAWSDGIRWRSLRESAKDLQLVTHRMGPFDPTFHGGESAAVELARQGTTAVITFNDRMAIGLIRRLTTLGACVPEDVSVIGFDNIFTAELVTPALTTVAAMQYAMGTVAVHNLLAVIHGAHTKTHDPTLLPSRLVVRESTAQRNRHHPQFTTTPAATPLHDK